MCENSCQNAVRLYPRADGEQFFRINKFIWRRDAILYWMHLIVVSHFSSDSTLVNYTAVARAHSPVVDICTVSRQRFVSFLNISLVFSIFSHRNTRDIFRRKIVIDPLLLYAHLGRPVCTCIVGVEVLITRFIVRCTYVERIFNFDLWKFIKITHNNNVKIEVRDQLLSIESYTRTSIKRRINLVLLCTNMCTYIGTFFGSKKS